MLVNDVSLRNLIPAELAKGFGFFHGKPSTAFSPVAVTPDELGAAWRRQGCTCRCWPALNGKPFGRPNAGVDMTFYFPQLIAHAAKTRRLGAGTIVGSGTVSNKDGDGPARPVEQGGVGYTCLAEVRTVETILEGKPRTPFLKFGDRVRIEMVGRRRPLDLRRHRAGGGPLYQLKQRTNAPGSCARDAQELCLDRRSRREEHHLQRDRARPLRLHGQGDPNSGIIIGDDGVIVIDAQATPGGRQAGDRPRAQGHRQADQVRRALALSRRARARRVGLRGAGDHRLRYLPRHDRRARPGGLGFRVRPLPAPVPRRRERARASPGRPSPSSAA